MNKTIIEFIKEIITIIVGILIALYINNWNEDRKDAKYIDQIFISMNKELRETNYDIDEKLIKQRTLIDSLNFYMKDDELSLSKVIEKSEGIFVPLIKLNSWKAISNSKIELIEYDKISVLSDIEEQKELLKMKADKLIDFIYVNYKETGEIKKEFLKVYMLEIISTEIDLQKDIQKIIVE
ncbi:DUF6090 family protein [Maribacter sp. M208]|uniref:DUF6090 family protein n=1 Tax=Maribacter huludaoensis TaxID=3030010 RepID=UPI0023ED2696|nr:DUF6090 family protein [Maribacter huludaoensis]MDF4221929.1 DUF6090 family protein [Maribacter huludaoensis]